MKLIQLLTLGVLLSFASPAMAKTAIPAKPFKLPIAAAKDPVSQAKLQQMDKIKQTVADPAVSCCSNSIPITQTDLDNTLGAGFVITAPGVYCFASELSFNTALNNTAAITIDVPLTEFSNVVILMNGYALTKDPASTGTSTTGILVNNGQTNVLLTNGAVENFDLYGVRLNTGVAYFVADNVHLLGNGNSAGPFGGFSANNCQDLVLHNVIADANIGIGASFAGVQRAVIVESSFSSNTGANVIALGGPVCWGALMTNLLSGVPCRDISFINCTASNNSSDGVGIGIECVGIPLPGDPLNEDISIINCIACHNTGGPSAAFTQEGEGFAVIGVNNFLVKGCLSEGNHTNAEQPSGIAGNFSSSGFSIAFLDTGGVIEDCIAINNSGNGDISAGFRIMRGADVVVNNCVALDHTNNGFNATTQTFGEAWGFTTDPDIGNFLGLPQGLRFTFDSCQANDNNAPDAPSGFSGGFKFVSQVGSLLTNCTAQGNGIGIFVTNAACCSIDPGHPGSCCCLEAGTCCATGIPSCCTATSGNCACTNTACDISTTCCKVTKNNIVSDNILIGNFFGGIVDKAPCGKTAYYNNQARSNGDDGTLNYVGLISPIPSSCKKRGGSGTPIRLWDLHEGAPCTKDNNDILDPLDNLDIRP